jgi:hypothetical protein
VAGAGLGAAVGLLAALAGAFLTSNLDPGTPGSTLSVAAALSLGMAALGVPFGLLAWRIAYRKAGPGQAEVF